MITHDLCRIVLDGQENPESFAPSIRSFLKTVEAKNSEIIAKKDSVRLSKWIKKLFQICVQIKSLSVDLQLTLNTNLYFKLMVRFLTMYLDATIYFAKKVPNPEEIINQAFKDILIIQEYKGSTGYVWSVIANSLIMKTKFVKSLDIVIALAITRLRKQKTKLTHDQFIRMAYVFNSFVGEPDKFDTRAKEAHRIKVQDGLNKFLWHNYSKSKWAIGLSAEDAKTRLLIRENRPPKDYFALVSDTIKKEDVTNLHQINLFAEQLSTSSVKISGISDKLVDPSEPKMKDKKKNRDEKNQKDKVSDAEKENDKVVEKVREKEKIVENGSTSKSVSSHKTDNRENEVPNSSKRSNMDENELKSKRTKVEETKSVKSPLPWEVAWSKLTHEPEIKLIKLNLKKFKRISKDCYLVTSTSSKGDKE